MVSSPVVVLIRFQARGSYNEVKVSLSDIYFTAIDTPDSEGRPQLIVGHF